MLRNVSAIALVATGLAFSNLWRAAGQDTTPAPVPAEATPAPAASPDAGQTLLPERHWLDAVPPPDMVFRFGYWGSSVSGSPSRVGYYQNLSPSPFWEVDGLRSNGSRTLDFTIGQTDQDGFNARGYFYRPGLEIKVDYEHFLRQAPHDAFPNMTDAFDPSLAPSVPPGDNSTDPQPMVKQDLNLGQNYAIRVQELKNSYKYQLTDNIRVRLDVWGLSKQGYRQENAMSQCFPSDQDPLPPGHNSFVWGNSPKCHLLSQAQRIDWQTTEVKPVIEANFGDVTVEYSRPMRTFQANDSSVFRTYGDGGDTSGGLVLGPANGFGSLPYGVVPNSTNQFDQVKVHWDVNEDNKFYAFMSAGAMTNEEIGLNRFYNVMDFRWTNTAIENVTITPYAKIMNDNTQAVNVGNLLAAAPEDTFFAGDLGSLQDINRQYATAGVRTLWRPFGRGFGLGGLAISGGYEYEDLNRTGLFDNGLDGTPFVEPNSITNKVWIRPSVRWSQYFDTYVQFKQRWIRTPLYGSRENLESGGNMTNSLLPTDEQLGELGFTWYPSDNFLLSGTVGLDNRDHQDSVANFQEQSYPFSLTAWYGVTKKWSLSAGYADFTDFTSQEMNVGDAIGNGISPFTGVWTYAGRAHVFNVGSRYAWSRRVRLMSQVAWVEGIDQITQAQGTSADAGFQTFPFIQEVSEQNVRIVNVTAGIDWLISQRVGAYFRYIYKDYADIARPFNSGTADMFLGGMSAVF